MAKEWLCDRCGYEGSECEYPQENHCEYFVERKENGDAELVRGIDEGKRE